MTKGQIKSCDNEWSRKVRERDGVCQWKGCHLKESLHAHHLVGRRNRSTRWYIPNGYALCPLHHTFGSQSAHQNAPMFDEMCQEDWDRFRDVVDKGKKIVKDIDVDKVKSHLRGELEYYA